MTELAPWIEALLDADGARAADRWAMQERGVAGVELMERAGAGVVRALCALAPDGPVTVVCGKGNNGGDGLVVARLLREAGRAVTVVCVASPEGFSGDARVNLERLPGEGPVRLDGVSWAQANGEAPAPAAAGAQALEELFGAQSAVVDALLGTGFSGEPHGPLAEAIEWVNGARAPVVAVDVPSGVDASSGAVRGRAVWAALTATFHAAKPGLWVHPGKAHTGSVEVVDIGIPRGAPAHTDIGLISSTVIELLPRREASSTKFVSGHVLVAGGSRGLTGAPRMAAEAAMRAGAGYVTGCVPSSVQDAIAGAATPELMTRALPESEWGIDSDAVAVVLEAAARGGSLALGPGLGRSEGAVAFARELAARAELPLVLDADGLNAHAGRLPSLRARSASTVLTPHAGELARLLDLDSAEIERERLAHVRAAAAESGAVVVLKGDDTLVSRPDGTVAISRGASPALATAGTGDVLSGVIAALLAQDLEPFAAAAAGVALHAEAGRVAARSVGAAEGVIATDVIAALPTARSAMLCGETGHGEAHGRGA